MGHRGKKKSKSNKLRKATIVASQQLTASQQTSVPQIGNHAEFPTLAAAFSSSRCQMVSPDVCLELQDLGENGVNVGGTIYYNVQAGSPFGEPGSPISPIPPYQKDLIYRTCPVRNYHLNPEEQNGPAIFMSQQIRVAIHQKLEEYRSNLFSAEYDTVFDKYYFCREMEKTSGSLELRENKVYLARKDDTGEFCIVRQFFNIRLRNEGAIQIREKWKTIDHPNVVRLKTVFTSNNSGGSVLFVYDFWPKAVTLTEFLSKWPPLKEDVVWDFIVQILCGLHAIHESGLAARVLTTNTLLVTGIDYSNIKLNCMAVSDVFEEHCSLDEHRKNDLIQLGRVIENMINALDHCSGDLNELANSFTSGAIESFESAIAALGSKAFRFLSLVQKQNQILEDEICREVENGRLFKLLLNILQASYICEQNSTDEWMRLSGQPLRMFMDFLSSRASIYEVISNLNKLDVGILERINLRSLDGSSSIVISFEELRKIFEDFFDVYLQATFPMNESGDSGTCLITT